MVWFFWIKITAGIKRAERIPFLSISWPKAALCVCDVEDGGTENERKNEFRQLSSHQRSQRLILLLLLWKGGGDAVYLNEGPYLKEEDEMAFYYLEGEGEEEKCVFSFFITFRWMLDRI